ncbi:MAG: hypothetical protein WKG07_31955 [Hymenobacter sp.]
MLSASASASGSRRQRQQYLRLADLYQRHLASQWGSSIDAWPMPRPPRSAFSKACAPHRRHRCRNLASQPRCNRRLPTRRRPLPGRPFWKYWLGMI